MIRQYRRSAKDNRGRSFSYVCFYTPIMLIHGRSFTHKEYKWGGIWTGTLKDLKRLVSAQASLTNIGDT